MFAVITEKNNLRVEGSELMTSGSVNINFIELITSEDWFGLVRVILFRTQTVTIAISIGIDDGKSLVLAIPWEVLEHAGETVQVGLYGVSQANFDEIVMPTIWGTIGKVVQGVFLSGSERPNPSSGNLFVELIDKIDQMDERIENDLIQFDYLSPEQVQQIVDSNNQPSTNQNRG